MCRIGVWATFPACVHLSPSSKGYAQFDDISVIENISNWTTMRTGVGQPHSHAPMSRCVTMSLTVVEPASSSLII